MSLGSVGTMAGKVAATLMVVNVVQHMTGWSERWFALAVAGAISLGVGFFIKREKGAGAGKIVFTALLNAFLIYASAFGVQNSLVSELAPPTLERAAMEETRAAEEAPPLILTRPASPHGLDPVGPSLPSTEPPVRLQPDKPDVRQFTSPW